MFQFIVIFGVLLLLIILYTLFRISRLVSVVKGSDKKVATTSNKVNAALFMFFLFGAFGFFFWYSWTYFDDYTLPVASEHGIVTDTLFWTTMAVTGIVFLITNVLLFWFSYAYQHKEGRKASFYPDNHKIEILWTVVPALVLTGLVFTGLRAWNDITSEAQSDAEIIEIMGYQFAWGVRYPGVKDNALGEYNYQMIDAVNQFGMDLSDKNTYDDFMPIEMHIPKGKEVLLKIRARDVLHSVFLPHFRVKMDAVPGMPTHFKFTATKSTAEMRAELENPEFNYFVTCTEICGRGHFSMVMKLVVDEPADYEKWKAEQPTWLKLNPDYLAKVPEANRELAKIKSGMVEGDENNLKASL
ncbi:MAG: cytochrome c oxidase subunit II [Bacteroidota bacterium]